MIGCDEDSEVFVRVYSNDGGGFFSTEWVALEKIQQALKKNPEEITSLALYGPVSWKGTLQQYAGRLHREHADKTDVRIIDFVDTSHPALLRMWEKRQRGYRAMGYRIAEPSA